MNISIHKLLTTTLSLTIVLLSGGGPAMAANDCAIISTVKYPFNYDSHKLHLTRHNGHHLLGFRGEYEKLALEPGLHEFTSSIGYEEMYPDPTNTNVKGLSVDGKSFTFSINVEAGKLYKVYAIRNYPRVTNPHKQYSPTVMSITETECDQSSTPRVLAAKSTDSTANIRSPEFGVTE